MSSVIYYPGYSQVQVRENLIVQTIESITNSYPMVVTTVRNHGYIAGMMVRFLIPSSFGMVELNGLNAQVLALTDDTLSIDIDSTNFSSFSYPSPLPSAYTVPSIIPTSSGPYLPPKPLPEGNQNSFEGVIYNNGTFNNPINGLQIG
jgi:hypothetical protein